MFVPPSTTRGTWRWGWEGVAQPVVEYILLAFAASIFVVVWLKWFYCIRLRIGRTDAQDEHSVLPTQQQSATYGSVSTAQRGAHRSKPGKTKQKTLAQHANTEPARTPTRAPTRSGTSGYTVNGRVPPQKGATIHATMQHSLSLWTIMKRTMGHRATYCRKVMYSRWILRCNASSV